MLIDILLQGEDGRKICKQLKSSPLTNYFPIILMSAAPDRLSDAVQYKADEILEKPFDIDLLISKVNAVYAY